MPDLVDSDVPIRSGGGRPPRPPPIQLTPTPEEQEATLRQSVPIFAEGIGNSNVMLKVQHSDPLTNQWTELGTCPAEFGLDEVLRHEGWARDGSFRFWLVDRETGRPVLGEPRTARVDVQHRVLVELRKKQTEGLAAPVTPTSGAGSISPHVIEQLLELVRREREQAMIMAERARDDQAAAAGSLSSTTTELAKATIESTRADSARLLEQQGNMMANFLAMQQTALAAQQEAAARQHEAHLARIQAERDAERTRMEAAAALERDRIQADLAMRRAELEREQNRMAEERREREARLERERQMEADRAERERQREKEAYDRELARQAEFSKLMLEAARRDNDPLGNVGSLVSKLTETAKLAGVDLPELVKGLLNKEGGEAASGGAAGIIAALVPLGVEALKTLQKGIEANSGGTDDEEDEGEDDPVVIVTMPSGEKRQMLKSEADALMAQRRALPGPAAPSAPIVPQHPQTAPVPVAAQPQPDTSWLTNVPGATPVPGAVQPEAPTAAPPAPPLPAARPVIKDALQVMQMSDLRAARRAAAALVAKLAALPSAQWQGELVAAVASNPPLLAYLTHVTLEGALYEANTFDDHPDLALSLLRVASEALPAKDVWLAGVAR